MRPRRADSVRLARSGKAYSIGRRWCVEGDFQLATGGNIETVDQSGEMLHDGRHRIRLDRVAQMDLVRQASAQLCHPPRNPFPVVREEGRATDAVDETGQQHAADLKATVCYGKLRATHIDIHLLVSNLSANSFARHLRSNLPLGDRGIVARSMISIGTM